MKKRFIIKNKREVTPDTAIEPSLCFQIIDMGVREYSLIIMLLYDILFGELLDDFANTNQR